MQRRWRRIGLMAMAFALVGCPSYSEMMQKDLRTALGDDFKKYYFFSYPTNNFGIGTMYTVADDGSISDDGELCASDSCFQVVPSTAPPPSPPASTPITGPTVESLSLSGYANVGGGGAITLSQKDVTKVSANLVLPKIYNVLQVGAGVDTSRGVTTKIVIDEAFKRFLDKIKTEAFIKSLPNTDQRKVDFLSGKLAYVNADVVVRSMSVDICVDQAVNANLNAALSSNVGKILGDGAQLQVGVNRSSNGCYNLSVTKPVVAAVRTVKQRSAGVLEAATPSSDWYVDHNPVALRSSDNGRNGWHSPLSH